MKPASINELSKDLKDQTPENLIGLCLKLAKFKKENKEFLTYLLRQSDNEALFVENLKEEISNQFGLINTSNTYFAKKGLRKVLRYTDRFIKYSGDKETEVEVRIHYCLKLKRSDIRIERSILISNLYNRQIEKIRKRIDELHEDLQYDYLQLMRENDL